MATYLRQHILIITMEVLTGHMFKVNKLTLDILAIRQAVIQQAIYFKLFIPILFLAMLFMLRLIPNHPSRPLYVLLSWGGSISSDKLNIILLRLLILRRNKRTLLAAKIMLNHE